ncbi:MAG: hypothetical protein K1X53_07275 [Candidatus Sumerlaeaceae bacterium]|nr:hypothetical protein [Candidatus Sumerlaeaceae bacterium]
MISKNVRLILATGLVAACLPLSAQNTFQGVNIFVTGESTALDGYAPGGAQYQLRDDGTGGDSLASDKVYTRDVTIGNAPKVDGDYKWKVASTGFSPVSYPFGIDNSFTRGVTTGSLVKFVFDTNQKNDNWVPDPDGGSILGVLQTIPYAVMSTDTIKATGDFQVAAGLGSNWDAGTTFPTNLHDDGLNGDLAAGDNVYTLQLSGLAANTYNYKLVVNGAFTYQAGTAIGHADGGGNLSFLVINTTDTIKLLYNRVSGRSRYTSTNPAASPGPPWYATSSAWGTTLDAITLLYDDGTNGDVTNGDGIYSRRFTVATPTTTTVQVKQGAGPSYPGTGGYPFQTTINNQKVLVQFDGNTLADGYSPNKRYVWMDPGSRRNPPYVQAVGDFMSEIAGGDWNNNDPNYQMLDNGVAPDTAASDGIYGLQFAGGLTGGLVAGTYNWKGLGLQGSWDYQFGGSGDGATFQGNNPNVSFSATASTTLTFKVDAVTGRVAAVMNAALANPSRPSSINASGPPAGVPDWSMY